MADSCIMCGCGRDIGKYKLAFEEAKSKGTQEALFDKLELELCCRLCLTSLTTIKDYIVKGGK